MVFWGGGAKWVRREESHFAIFEVVAQQLKFFHIVFDLWVCLIKFKLRLLLEQGSRKENDIFL